MSTRLGPLALGRSATVAARQSGTRAIRYGIRSSAMAKSSTSYQKLADELREIDSLQGISSILSWDELVVMKPKSAESRAAQKSALASVLHQRMTSKALGDLIASAEREVDALDAFEKASVRDARRQYDRKIKLPAELAKTEARLGSEGYQAWAKAKESGDYAVFKPFLESIVRLRQEEAAAVAPDMSKYDFQIDKFERGMTAPRLKEIFDELKPGLVDLIKEVSTAIPLEIHHHLRGAEGGATFDPEVQASLCEDVMRKLGFDGILSRSLHPFTGGTAQDVRITTRYDPSDFISGVAGLVHETGHALYEENRPCGPQLGLPVSSALSMGIHESMSLLFERMVGQSEEFWEYFQPLVEEKFEHMKGVPASAYYDAINQVKSSNLIRVDADELTYPLHIIIRFELEQGLFDGTITCDDLPERWNQLYEKYLGLKVPNDKEGVLQDVHWGSLAFGYFPSYSLGAMYACQFFQEAERAIPGLRGQIREGNFEPLRAWLTENIHSKGSLYPSADELCEAVTGKKLDPKIYLEFLRKKYRKLYKIQ